MSDHEVVKFRGALVPILGTVGGTPEQSRETAKNIEAFFARGQAAQRAVDEVLKKHRSKKRKPRSVA